MHMALVTPRPPAEQAGNETTSDRWAALLRDLDHEVDVVYSDESFRTASIDVLVALHAYRSDDVIRTFDARHPERPIVLALTGTDLYKYRNEHPEVDANIRRASAVVVLQEKALEALDDEARAKTHVIYQSIGRLEEVEPSIDPGARAPNPDSPYLEGEGFEVCVAAHLRDVKDPLRTTRALEHLESDSEIRVTHIGRALSDDWERRAREADEQSPRYRWHGEIPRAEALDVIAGADLLASTSRLEGGPNVVSEAVALGTPVIASEIPGHVGLLGDDYPGYVPVDDERRLAELLRRAETDDRFYQSLLEATRRRAFRFTPEQERRAWSDLLDDVTS